MRTIKLASTYAFVFILAFALCGCATSSSHSSNSSNNSSLSRSSSAQAESSRQFTMEDVPTAYPSLNAYDDYGCDTLTYDESKVISYKDAKDYIGREMTVQGSVSSAHHATSANGSPYFINFGDREFCAVIWEENWNDINMTELDYLVSAYEQGDTSIGSVTFRISGVITEFEGEPQIVVRHGSQIADNVQPSNPDYFWFDWMSTSAWHDAQQTLREMND